MYKYTYMQTYIYMCIYTFTHICVHIHTSTHIYIHVSTSTLMHTTQYTYTCIHAYTCMCTYTCTHINPYIYVHAHSNICMNMHTYIYVYMCACACKYLYLYAHVYIPTYIWVHINVCIHTHICMMGTHPSQVYSTHTFSPSGGWLSLCCSFPFPAVLFSWMSSHISIFVLILLLLPCPWDHCQGQCQAASLHFLLAACVFYSTLSWLGLWCEMETSFYSFTCEYPAFPAPYFYKALLFPRLLCDTVCVLVCSCMCVHAHVLLFS